MHSAKSKHPEKHSPIPAILQVETLQSTRHP